MGETNETRQQQQQPAAVKPPPSNSDNATRSGRKPRGRGGRGRGGRTNQHDSSSSAAATTANNNNKNNGDTSGRTGNNGARGRGRGRGRSNGRGGRGGRSNTTNAAGPDIVTDEPSATPAPTPPMRLPISSALIPTKPGIPVILTRQINNNPNYVIGHADGQQQQQLSNRFAAASITLQREDTVKQEEMSATTIASATSAAAAVASDGSVKNENRAQSPFCNVALNEKPNKKKPLRKKREPKPATDDPVVEQPPTPIPVVITTTDALKNLPAQEVSITSASLVKVRKVESVESLVDKDEPTLTLKKKSTGKKKGLSNDHKANRKAALIFNRNVRACVERSDPVALTNLLHDRTNHNFALEATVLETVLKAYVMAAMFDDGLYCLRNCTLPGTMSCAQAQSILLCLPQNLRNSSAFVAADMINALCIATEFDVPTKRTYFLRIVRGIALEFLEEATSARDRICSAPCERLVRSSMCVVDARLKRGKKVTELLVDPGHQLGVFVPDSMENRGIQAGDAVSILPYAGPYPMSAESLDRNMIEATVTSTNPMLLRLQDKTNAQLYNMLTENVEGNVYRIDKLANRMGFNRQLAAAVAMAAPLDSTPRRPSAELIQAITAMDENMVMSNLRASRGHEMTSTAALCSTPVAWNEQDQGDDVDCLRDASRLALERHGALEGLNASQALAVEGAATNRLTLVQGPPGTGKTAVAIRILQHWARLAVSEGSSNPILATSDSNIAVDNLVEGCANAGLRVVRLGRPEAIRPELLRFCIDRPPAPGSNSQQGTSAAAIKEKLKTIRNAQVVCCTCIGSGGDILEKLIFERVLLDEATQATEPAVLVPLTRGCRQLVLVGDHCQLPPTVLSTRAEEEGLGVPLFSRMVACGVPPFMLDTQYRMHPGIAMFPSDLFYGGKLRNGVSAPERRPLAGFPWPREEFPVAFVPVNHGREMDDGVSKINEAEAAATCDAVAALLAGGQCSPSDIAVVTPYAAQARLIRRMTKQLCSGPPYVEVSSTDGFQGREKEAVVFSAVRSNDYGAVGFVSDWRRVNVSFTRARRALIVIGNDQTLRRGDPDTWMPWLAWADAHGLNMDKPGIPRGRYEPEQLRRVRGGTTAAEMLKDVLARQQAQLKTAENQLATAERNTKGHIIGQTEDEANAEDGDATKSLEQDLAQFANSQGNWDDSDDEDAVGIHRSASQPTMSTVSSSNDMRNDPGNDGPLDAWDL